MRYEPMIRSTFKVSSVSGQEFLCMCPWHKDTSNGHLYVNGVKGAYLCMSCGAKGWLDKMDLKLPQTGTDDIREKIAAMKAKDQPQKFYPEAWLDQFDIPHPYWTEERGLPESTVKQFRLGYDVFVDRMTLPLRDQRGRILGVTHRRLDDGKPKYLHPKGFPTGRHLYGAWLLSGQPKVALVEGQVDAVRCWSYGVPALALMGARITPAQIKVLQRANIRHVVLMLDNDNAGVKGNVGINDALSGTGIRVTTGWYRNYWFDIKDPDGLNRQRLRKMFHSSISVPEWAEKVIT